MDERVASAISHWGPRFTTNGVTVADFERVTNSVEKWSDWCAAWSAAGAGHEGLGRAALADGRLRSAGSISRWRRSTSTSGSSCSSRSTRRCARRTPTRCAASTTRRRIHLPGERVEIPFEGTRLVGAFRAPRGEGTFPAVLMLPGLDSAKEELRSTEKTFLDRGIATFSLDGPGQGETEYDLPIRGDWSAPGAAALDALGALPVVDADRLAVWGVSLGGYYSPRVAAAVGDR